MTAQDIKILGVTITYNNEDKVPYVMPYYERMGIDKLVVYDNNSTDRTVEMLSKYPFVEIRPYETDEYREDLLLQFKTGIQTEFRGQYDWCICADFDEVFYSEQDFREVLYEKMCEGKTYFRKTALNIVSRTFPPTDKLIHETVGKGALWTSDDETFGIFGNKTCLFNMNHVFVTYDKDGCHECSMQGELSQFDDKIAFFHLKFIDFDFIVKSSVEYNNRIKSSDPMSWEYYSKHMNEVYNLLEKRSISIEEYMNTSMYDLLPQQVIFAVNETNKGKITEYINRVKASSKSGIARQYAILFYGKSDEDYSDVWWDGMNKRQFTMFQMNCNNLREAIANESNRFWNTKIYEPWVAKIDSIDDISGKLIKHIEEHLPIANKHGIRNLSVDNINFSKVGKILADGYSTLACYFITKNAEKTIKACIDSIITVCDEIVVVDTGSEDKTIEILDSYKLKVKRYHFDWVNDYSAARNFALSKVKADYALMVDSDEQFTHELRETITNLKEHEFYGIDWWDMWILHYNKTVTPDTYLGAKQIVRMACNPHWKYRTHEKLYADTSNIANIGYSSGYVLHKHHGGTHPKSNYYRYAELYYNDINGSNHLTSDKSAHYFYYMFFTLKDFDYYLSKLYLYNVFQKNRIAVPNEDIRVHLYKDNYISLEDFLVYEMIDKEPEWEFLAKFAETLKEDIAKNMLRKFVYDRRPELLSKDALTDLALFYYNNGFVQDFIRVTKDNASLYGKEWPTNHNLDFISTYVKPFANNTTLAIDCRAGYGGISSNVYYFSKMFRKIAVICDKDDNEWTKDFSFDCITDFYLVHDPYSLGKNIQCYIVDGNTPMTKDVALREFENAMYGRPTEVLKKRER